MSLELILGGVVAALAGIIAAFFKGKKTGRTEAEHDAIKDNAEREEKGRQAVRDGRDSGKSPSERVLDNDAEW